MRATRLKIIRLWSKIGRYVPLLYDTKCLLCKLRFYINQKQIKKYRSIAKDSGLRFNILVLMGGGIGNAVESSPLVQTIRRIWPKSWIAVRPPSGGLFDNWPEVDFIANSPNELKGMKFDHTFVAWGGSISANKGHCPLGQIHYTEDGQNLRGTKPEREYNIDMLRRLGYEGSTAEPFVYTQKPQIEIPQGNLRICFVPCGIRTHRWRNRRWPYFDKLAPLILGKHSDAQIYVVGTMQDEVPAELFNSYRVTDFRGKLTLPETAWIISNCDLAIGNDCGPMHIAGATQTLSIAIFGPTNEFKDGPVGRCVFLRHNVSCEPCVYDRRLFTCKDPICMTGLKPEIVLNKAEELLKETKNLETDVQ